MVDAQHNPMTLLLVHNAVAVIVAVFLSHVFRVRVLIAILSLVVALYATFSLRTINVVSEISWWLFIHEPASSFYDPIIHDTMWRAPGMLGTFGLITAFISPFVFAYYAACRWTPPRNTCSAELPNRQLRLRSILIATTACCFLLGFHSWLDTQIIAVYPVIIAATCLVIRPMRCCTDIKRRLKHDKRLAELRKRIREGADSGSLATERPEIRWSVVDFIGPSNRSDAS